MKIAEVSPSAGVLGLDRLPDRPTVIRNLLLFGGLQPADVPGMNKFEVTVGDAAMGVDDAEITAAFAALLAIVH